MRGFNSFDPADDICTDDKPLPGTVWDGWINGVNPRIDPRFAQMNYWSLIDALGCFISGATGTYPERYKGLFGQDKNDQAQALFIQEFSPFIQETMALIGDEKPIQPFTFETLVVNSQFLSAQDWCRTLAAYSIWCMDRGMAGLLNGSAADAAIGFTYSQIALGIAHETRREVRNSHSEKHQASEMARRGARAKHKKTHEQRQQVIDYWREHIPPETSNEKAGAWLHDSFPNLSVRKLSEYVAQARKEAKEIPPASKA